MILLAILGHLSCRVQSDSSPFHTRRISSTKPAEDLVTGLEHPSPVKIDSEVSFASPDRQVLTLVLTLGIRIITFKQLTRHTECLTWPVFLSSVTILPILTTIPRIGRESRWLEINAWHVGSPKHVTTESKRRPDSLFCAISFLTGNVVMRMASSGPYGTVICPASGLKILNIPASVHQIVAILTDFWILRSTYRILFPEHDEFKFPLVRSISRLCLALAITAVCVICHGLIWFAFVPEDRYWMLNPPGEFLYAALKLDIIMCIMVVAGLHSLLYLGLSLTAHNICFSMSLAKYFLQANHLPARNTGMALLGFVISCCSGILQPKVRSLFCYPQMDRLDSDRPARYEIHRRRTFLCLVLGITLLAGSAAQLTRLKALDHHPIDRLIQEAAERHLRWRTQANTSSSLPEAVANYHQRYGRPPPPSFDKWYAFALDRNSSVIDDFDSIWKNLAPFLKFSPSEIRDRTWQVIFAPDNEDNDVAGLRIRGGKSTIHNVRDTHRWMMEGIQAMIRPFEIDLPDMDLAFNTNDEPRIVAGPRPQQNLKARVQATLSGVRYKGSFSKDRAKDWNGDGYSSAIAFDEMSFQNIFIKYAAHGCINSRSLALKHRWDQSQFCATCIESYSDGIFLADWRLSNDVCSQPDLAHLHGFYASPSSFKGTHKLLPIFSQSKAPNFDDIIYPSAWNYMDKVMYAPTGEYPDVPFESKKASLFWRGGTTEGFSPGSNAWSGFARQRFHHLLNSNVAADGLVLLPEMENNFRYKYVKAFDLQKTLAPDVKLTEPIVRCGGRDCINQAEALGPLVAPTDFQAHWSYKYLLDLDGAGFSGRFLPFLRSRSLPFKAALFREWFDDRLEAWVHFVPLDLRGTGLWATLLYFMGWPQGRGLPQMTAQEAKGSDIAMAGREWAQLALRKEDMEIYMFRLLLEWARITDDLRDELGFSNDNPIN